MATIVDVARIAGVSASTVSHVVNGTRNVNDETRARVQEAILRTGYVRDAAAERCAVPAPTASAWWAPIRDSRCSPR